MADSQPQSKLNPYARALVAEYELVRPQVRRFLQAARLDSVEIAALSDEMYAGMCLSVFELNGPAFVLRFMTEALGADPEFARKRPELEAILVRAAAQGQA